MKLARDADPSSTASAAPSGPAALSPDAAPTPAASAPPAQPRWRMLAAFASVYVLWGSTYVAIRFAIESLPPLGMAGVRFLVAGGILYTLARVRGAPRPSWPEVRAAGIVGVLLLGLGNGGVVLAERSVPSGLVALLIAGTPLWMTILDMFGAGGTRPTRPVIVGLVAGLAGVAVLIGPPDLSGGTGVDPLGAALVLGASLSWSGGSLYSRRTRLPESPLVATGVEMLVGGAFLVIAGLLRGELTTFSYALVTPRAVLAWAYLVVAGSLFGFTAYIYLLRHTTPARAASYAYVNPVIAVFLGWALASEPIGTRTFIAAPIIIGALVLITRAKR